MSDEYRISTLEAIVRTLADKDAPVHDARCALCHQQVFADLVEGKGRDLTDPAEHLPTCEWRRARELRGV